MNSTVKQLKTIKPVVVWHQERTGELINDTCVRFIKMIRGRKIKLLKTRQHFGNKAVNSSINVELIS